MASEDIYTVICKNQGNESSLDPNRNLIYSNDSAPSPVPLPEDESTKTTLQALCGNSSLYSLLVKIRQAFKTYEDLATRIEDIDENDRLAVMTFYINMESRYSRIQEDISRILEGAGVVEAIRIEMVEIRQGLPKLRGKAIYAECASVVVKGSDSTENSSEGADHLLLHPGYAIRDCSGFLKHFGHIALHLLRGYQGGLEQNNKEGEAGDSRELLRMVEGSLFSAGELRVLMGMAIESLQRLVTPQMELGLGSDIIRRLPLYLIDDSGALDMPLYPIMHDGTPGWVCKDHYYATYTESALTSLCDHVRSLEGHFNMQKGTWVVKVNLIEEVREFFKVVSVTEAIIDLTLSLLWEATESELQEIVVGANAVNVVRLRLDGNGFKDHPMYTTEQGSVFIHNIITANKKMLKSITFSNIPVRHKGPTSVKCVTFITNRRIVTTGLPEVLSSAWDAFKKFVFSFHEAVGKGQTNSSSARDGDDNHTDMTSDNESNDKDTDTVHCRNMDTLRRLVEEHQYVLALTYLTENHQAATFDMPNGVFHGLVEVRFPMEFSELFLYKGTLRHFVLEVDSSNRSYLSILGKVLKYNPDLPEVRIGTRESILLSQIVFCCSCISGRANPLHVSFYDECVGAQERVVAKLALSSITQAAIEGSDNHSRCEFSFSSIDIKAVEWAMDYGSEALNDDEAAVLDTITAKFPDTLIYFNLDIRDLTKAGIESIRRVLSRSSIQFLRINCGLFDVDLKPSLVHALAHLQRSSLLSLILRGEAVVTWLELLAEATTLFTSQGPTKGSLVPPEYQLVQFEVNNTAPERHSLSTRAMDTFFQVIQSSSLIELSLVNVDLPSSQHWDLVMDELDQTYLKIFNVVNSNK
ncbi:hypothetical protein CPB97_004887 [Podila verticillata]|nr:hypothetical protein CPB97_004887 [Podila verticillata]